VISWGNYPAASLHYHQENLEESKMAWGKPLRHSMYVMLTGWCLVLLGGGFISSSGDGGGSVASAAVAVVGGALTGIRL